MMDQREAVRAGYDIVSRAYRSDDAPDGEYDGWLRELSAHLAPGASILDLGCGCGIPSARWLVQHGFKVTGVDFSPVQIQRARTLVPEGRFLCADITELKFDSGQFDAIVSFYAVIHVPLDDQPSLFHTMHRLLKPRGWMLVTVGFRAWTGSEDNWLGAPMYWSHEGTDAYLQWLDDAGFSIEWQRFVPEGSGGHTLILARA